MATSKTSDLQSTAWGNTSQEATTYDEWVREKVKASRTDARPSISNEDIKTEFAKRRDAMRTLPTR
jgi:hypothetical protein